MNIDNFIVKSVHVNPDTSIVAHFVESLSQDKAQSWGADIISHEIIFYPNDLPAKSFPSLLRQATHVNQGTASPAGEGWLIHCTIGLDGVRVVEPNPNKDFLLLLVLLMKREANAKNHVY